ncbi:MAG: Rpn family recombination-promoting nuclease/putative transposase [Planctomycetaceae bacterium]|jgi:hypothetical protein|nr:Rpn family recombination-promoting nuclease/putative transposase [Planctomycetaceae bacterium]
MSKLIQAQHDKLFRKVFGKKENAANLIQEYLPADMSSPINFKKIQPLPNNDFGTSLDEHITDLRFIAPTKDGKNEAMAMILTEHKSYQDDNVSFQVGIDLFAGWRTWWIFKGRPNLRIHPLPGPILFILYNGKEPFNLFRFRDLVAKIKGLEIFVPDFEIWVVDLSKILPEGMKGTPFTRANLLALKYGGEGTIAKRLPEIFEPFKDLPVNEEIKENTQDVLTYAESVDELDTDTVQEALKFIFPKNEVKIMTNVMFKDVEARGQAKTIIVFLKARFNDVPKEIIQKITSIKSPTKLDALAKFIVKCQSLEEFTSKLK